MSILKLPFQFVSRSVTAMAMVVVLPSAAAPLERSDPTHLSSRAADAATTPAAAPNGTAKAGLLDTHQGAVDVPNQSKTIEMLLEMQGKNPGLAGGEPVRRDEPPVARGTPPAPAPAPATPQAPFGAVDASNPFGTATMSAQPARAKPTEDAVDWAPPQSSRFSGGMSSGGGVGAARYDASSTGSGTASGDEDDVRWLIPRPVVRFVRQNRELVIAGSVLLLIVLWGATAISSGRRK